MLRCRSPVCHNQNVRSFRVCTNLNINHEMLKKKKTKKKDDNFNRLDAAPYKVLHS